MKRARVAAVLALLLALPALAQQGAQQTVHLLDYIGVDYAGAVENGKVKDADEYREMVEFAARVREQVGALGENPAKAKLVAGSAALATLVANKAPAAAVSEAASSLRWLLIGAYGLRVAPRQLPDLARGKPLYTSNCAACHGAEGGGDGPAAKGLDPSPSDFHDAARMSERSLYGLYNAITLGVSGTAMAAFAQLRDEERWALAFQVARLGIDEARVKSGEAAWSTPQARAAFPDLASLTGFSAEEVRRRHGDAAASAFDYLRVHPEVLQAGKPAPIAFARAHLAESLAAIRAGDRAKARDLAIAAYLEGFELVEASLDNVDKGLRLEIEREMMALRGAIAGSADVAALESRVARIDDLLAAAEGKLGAGELSAGAAFASALIILLREGLEAILLLAAIVAFVSKTGRKDALPYVHAGWVAALAAGFATWLAARSFIEISGSSRELTEGVTALAASVMLLYVGYWLHGRSQARAWNAFIQDSVGRALEKKTLWAMAGVSFLAVYRELFEVILFFEALWVQAGDDGHGAVLGGAATAVVLLAIAAWGMLRYSVRLPLGPFFAFMSALLALLAIVFAGQGIAALQEAGVVEAHPVAFFTLSMLGVHPTLETLGAQMIALAIVLLGAWAARRAPASAAQQKKNN